MSKFELITQQFEMALQRLEEVLQQEKNAFMRDSAIQRFEFTFDLSWKAIKAYLQEIHGIECFSPKGCFREAYQQGLIVYDPRWLEMVDDRNKTAHLYKEVMAERVYAQLPDYLQLFKKLLQGLK